MDNLPPLSLRELYQIHTQEGPAIVYRLLWISPDFSYAFVIEIDDDINNMPSLIHIDDLMDKIRQGIAKKIDSESYTFSILDSPNPSAAEKTAKEVREVHWKLVQEIMIEPDIYLSELRGRLIEYAVKKFGVSRGTAYNILRRFWKRGMTKLALTPNFADRGGKGKAKGSGSKKRGRPGKWGAGINITEEIQEQMREALNKYYYKKAKKTENPKSKVRYSLKDTYILFLRDYFCADVRYNDSQRKFIILKHPEQYPTEGQFTYWYIRELDMERKIRARKGDKKYERDHRPVLGSSVLEAFGPGSKFQIDATVGDVYLLSMYNDEWIIGKPVIYIVTDVYSRMIVGLYIGLEGPSWMGMAMALANTVADKVKFCADLGIEISPRQWPVHHIPGTLLGDNGELRDTPVESFIDTLGVKIENAAAYRPDLKGIVESKFKMIKDKVTPYLPGAVLEREIGMSDDYRLDATLNLRDFYEIMIYNILRYNSTELEEYPLEEKALTERVGTSPLELWNWGCREKGAPNTVDEDIVKLNLMRTKVVSISGSGIKFQDGLYYTCNKAVRDKWFSELAARGQSAEITVAYDPRNMDQIYLKNASGSGYEVCRIMTDRSRGYVGKSLYDINYAQAYRSKDKSDRLGEKNQRELDYITQRDSVIKRAEERKNNSLKFQPQASKKKRVEGIRDNRMYEKEMNRHSEAFVLEDAKLQKQEGRVLSFKDSKQDILSPTKENDLLRKLREEARRRDE